MFQSLDRLASAAAVVEGVRVGDLEPGDCLFVRTRNSLYMLRVNADGTFDAEGGWFARQETGSPADSASAATSDLPAEASASAGSTTSGLPAEASAAKAGRRRRVLGCTWGGSALMTRMIAAPGMFLEFDNRVRTTRIREVRHLRHVVANTIH
jgi:hypothetical protein